MQSPRNIAVDAYRGFAMLLMMGEVLQLSRVAASYPGNAFWRITAFNQTHVEWAGLSLHDTIQPSFSFLVGVALAYSIAARIERGQPFVRMLAHTVWRSLVLIALGIFLRSTHSTQTYFTFEDTLTQIGLGYTFLFLLGFRSFRFQCGAFALILFGYWLAWALYPVPGPEFNWTAVGVPSNWPHNFSGFAAHWNKNSNLGTAIDRWFLNVFPRTEPFFANGGGYLTSSFIPTLGTMILGLLAGQWLKAAAPAVALAPVIPFEEHAQNGHGVRRAARRSCEFLPCLAARIRALCAFKKLLVTGSTCLAAGTLLHFVGICPIVKRIWTPSWVLFSGGVCFFFLAAFLWFVEVKGHRKTVFPLVVIGRNSIAAYVMAELCGPFVAQSLYIHLGHPPFQIFGQPLEPLLLGATVLLVYWLVLFWMYRRNIFLRI